jgi:hypothetical protein
METKISDLVMGKMRAMLSSSVTITGMCSSINSTLRGSAYSCWEYRSKKCFLATTLILIKI